MPLLRSSTRPTAVQCFFCLSPSLLPPHATSSSSSDPFASSSTPTSTSKSTLASATASTSRSASSLLWGSSAAGGPSGSRSSDRKGKFRIAEVGTKWNWQCERCGCWNVRDERGEMISDLPAMHDTSFNERSFSLRATPSSSHLPSTSGHNSTFCHSCLANQTLIMNMLANYLPDDDDPSYPILYADLPNYLTKLHSRYPPVCINCQPVVDAALQKSDQRAQVQAWGSALNRGLLHTQAQSASRAGRNRQDGEGDIGRRADGGDILVWRIRGILWWAGIGLSLTQAVLSTRPDLLADLTSKALIGDVTVTSLILAFHVLSIAWIAWDPYWLRRVRRRDQAKVHGREVWVRNMLLIMLLRIITSGAMWFTRWNQGGPPSMVTIGTSVAFGLEVALLVHSVLSVRVIQPVAIQLVRPVSLNSSPAPALAGSPAIYPSSPTGFSSLSIAHSNQPNTESQHHNHNRPKRANPIFGQMSLSHSQAQPDPTDNRQEESMDWEPSPAATVYNGGYTGRPPYPFNPLDEGQDDDTDMAHVLNYDWHHRNRANGKEDWDAFAINKQRMFPRSQGGDETGLESLLAGWGIGAGAVGAAGPVDGSASSRDRNHGGKLTTAKPHGMISRLGIKRGPVRAVEYVLIVARICGIFLSILLSMLTSSDFTTGPDTKMRMEDGMGIANSFLIGVEMLMACLKLTSPHPLIEQHARGQYHYKPLSTLDSQAQVRSMINILQITLRTISLSPLSSFFNTILSTIQQDGLSGWKVSNRVGGSAGAGGMSTVSEWTVWTILDLVGIWLG